MAKSIVENKLVKLETLNLFFPSGCIDDAINDMDNSKHCANKYRGLYNSVKILKRLKRKQFSIVIILMYKHIVFIIFKKKHKQNLWRAHLDAHWDHRYNTHILWNTIHGLSNRTPPPTLNTSITFRKKIATTPKSIANCYTKLFTTTQHTRQTDPLTEKHIKYKDITSHSLQLRSKRQ